MDVSYFENLDSKSKEWLNALTIEDCKQLMQWLKKRTKYLNDLPFVKKNIEDLELSTRAYNALKQNGLETVGDIFHFGVENIRLIRNIGSKTVIEIRKAVGH